MIKVSSFHILMYNQAPMPWATRDLPPHKTIEGQLIFLAVGGRSAHGECMLGLEARLSDTVNVVIFAGWKFCVCVTMMLSVVAIFHDSEEYAFILVLWCHLNVGEIFAINENHEKCKIYPHPKISTFTVCSPALSIQQGQSEVTI